MHFTIGETRYGKSEMRSDGSYVTIEWFHVCRLPVYPIRRIRVKPQYGRELIEELPRSLSPIFQTYAFVLAYAAWFVGVVYFIFARHSGYLDNQIGIWLAFLGFAAAMLVPYGLLLLARARSRVDRP
jgi:hypothetical protein